MLGVALRRERASEREETRPADQAREPLRALGRVGSRAHRGFVEALRRQGESAPGSADGRFSIMLQVPWQ